MDYFSELLESYSKLKKRTYKLTYINEADGKTETAEPTTDAATSEKAKEAADTAINDAPEISSKEIAAKGLKVVNVIGEPTNMTIYKNIDTGAVGVQGLGPQGGILSIIKNTGTSTNPNLEKNQEAYDKFVEKLSGKSDLSQTAKESLKQDEQQAQTEEEAAAEQEALRQERLTKVGSLIDADPARFPNAAEIKSLEVDSVSQIDDLCEKNAIPEHICRGEANTLQYIGGSAAKSLESKLVNGTGFIQNVDGQLAREQISSEAIQDVFSVNLDLLKEMGRSKPDCEYVSKRIGLVGAGKVAIFTNPDRAEEDTAEGVVVDRGGLHDAMLVKFGECHGQEGIKSHKFEGASADINEIKGRFNELFMGTMVRVYTTARSFRGRDLTPEEKKAELGSILGELAEHVDQQKAELGEFAGVTPLAEQGVVLENYPLMEEVDKQINVYNNPQEIKNVMQQMLIQLGTLVKQVEADDIIPAGTAQTLGGKVDNYFLYVGEDAAERAGSKARHLNLKPEDAITTTPAQLLAEASPAKQEAIAQALQRQGLSADDDTTPIATLSVGNKMSVGGTIKFGDLRLSRALDIVMNNPITGSAAPPDEAAYYEKLNTSLQMTPEETATDKEYMGSIQKESKRCTLLSQAATYNSENGEVKLTLPKQVATQVGSASISSFSYGQKGSAFYNACTKKVPNPHGNDPKTVVEVADFQDPAVQKKMTESLQRDYLSKQFNNDLNSEDPAKVAGATNSLCKIAGATIMEMSELSQVVTEEGSDSEPLVLNQNDILRGLGEARTKGQLSPPNIEVRGGTVSFKFKVNGKMISYKINMERQKGSAAFAGKIDKKEAEKAGKRVRRLKGKKQTENQDTMYEYLSGQISLLEKLIKQNY